MALATIFVLSLSSFASSESKVEMIPPNGYDCFEYADVQATRIDFWQDLTYKEEHQVFLTLFDDCMGQ